MQTLRDKLLQAGLVTEEQAKKAAEPAPPRPRPQRNEPAAPRKAEGSGPFITARPQPLGAHIPKLPPMAGSKAHQRLESLKQIELNKQLRDLVWANDVPLEPGDTVFYFVTRKGKLRRLQMSPAQALRLENGELAVVERPEPAQIEHSLVSAEIAERAHTLFPNSVRFFNRPGAPVGFLSDDEIKGRQADEQPEPTETEAAAPPAETGEPPQTP